MMKVRELMETAMGRQAADLHLQTGRPPMMRLAQGLCPLPGPPLSEGDLRQVLQAVGWSGRATAPFPGTTPCAAASTSAGSTPASM